MENKIGKKKILIFSTAYYPFVGGAEVSVKEITDRLKDYFEFDLITAKIDRKLPSIEQIGGVTVYRVGFGSPMFDKLFLPFLGARRAWILYKEKKYFCFWTIMVTFGSGAAYVTNILRAVLFRKKIPVVMTLQEGDSEVYLKYKWAGLISLSWKLALFNTDFLTSLSSFLSKRAKRYGYKGPSSIVPMGVDLKVFCQTFSDVQRRETVDLLGKKEGDIFLVTEGRLAKKNAIDDIISSLLDLPENISLIVIGKGDEGHILQEQATRLGVAGRVKFLGFANHVDVAGYFSVCDIFVRPSRSEGFGVSFIEAMASRLPVIATPVGGIVDFIHDKETGLFCTPDNPKSIVEAVNLLLEDSQLRREIIERAYSMVVTRFSWENIANKMKTEAFDRF